MTVFVRCLKRFLVPCPLTKITIPRRLISTDKRSTSMVAISSSGKGSSWRNGLGGIHFSLEDSGDPAIWLRSVLAIRSLRRVAMVQVSVKSNWRRGQTKSGYCFTSAATALWADITKEIANLRFRFLSIGSQVPSNPRRRSRLRCCTTRSWRKRIGKLCDIH